VRRESDPSAQEAAGSLIMVPTNPAAAAVTGSAGSVAGGQMAAALPEVTGENADAIDNLSGQGQAARTVTIAPRSLRPPAVGEPQAAWPAVSLMPLLCENC